MIFINFFFPIFAKNYGKRNSFLNEITIKIIGNDTQNILFENFAYPPDEIIIEGNPYSLSEKNTIMNLTNYENIIKMRWNSPLTDCWRMFTGLSNLIEIDLTNFDFSEVTRMNTMFQNCFNLEYINFNNNIEKKLIVDDMSYMFDKCRSLKSLDLSKLDTYNLKKMSQTFSNCWSLTSLNFNGFNTSSVITFMGMFNNCSSLKSIDLSSFDTSQVTIFNSMFYFCSSLTSINLSSFRTSKAFTMDRMFFECNKLKSLDISNFDTSNIKMMSNLFSNCSGLISLDISNFNIENADEIENMLTNCNNLQYINISNFKGKNNTNTANLFERVPENITYCFNSILF
jgi:surface protein